MITLFKYYRNTINNHLRITYYSVTNQRSFNGNISKRYTISDSDLRDLLSYLTEDHITESMIYNLATEIDHYEIIAQAENIEELKYKLAYLYL